MNFNDMGKIELRQACKEAGIKNYGKMNNEGMRAALEDHYAEGEALEAMGQELDEAQNPDATEYQAEDELVVGEFTNCPHCGVHLSNGVGLHGQEVNEKVIKHIKFEYACLACGEEFGPAIKAVTKTLRTSKGLKIEKVREERNGIKKPSVGGQCRAVWDALDKIMEAGVQPTSKQVKALAEEQGWNPNNASIEFYQWRKFHGIRGRQ